MHIDVLVPFFNVFRDEDLPLWLSIAIIGIGLLFFIWYYLHVYTPVSRALHKSVKDLNKIAGKSQFYAKFEHVDEIFNKPKLKQNWDGFKETFIFPGKFDEEKVIRNTIRPFKYFNFENLSQQYNISFYQAFPNIIVGVGLLLTFCGLVSAIYLTGQSIVAVHADPIASHSGNLKSALDSLLRIAAFKFLTSIAGLITSIVLTIEIRLCNGKLRNEYGRLNAILERNLQYESQEHLICTQQTIALRQLDYLRRQAEQFQSFTTTFAQETAQKTALAINSVVKLHAEKLYARIDPAITLMGEVIGKAADQAMTQLVRDFSAALRFEASQDMENLVNALIESQQALDLLSERVRESGESIALLLTQVGGEQRTAMKTLVDAVLDRFEESFSHVNAALNGATEAIATAEQAFHKNLDASAQLLENATSTIKQTEEQASDHLRAVADTLEIRVQAAADALATSATALAETAGLTKGAYVEATAQSASALQDTITVFTDKLTQAQTTMQTQVEGFANQTSRTTEQNNLLVQQSLQAIAETCSQSLEESIRSLNKTLHQTLTAFSDRLQHLTTAYDAHSAESAERLSKATEAAASHVTEVLDHAGTELKTIDTALRAQVVSAQNLIKTQVQELLAGLNTSVQESMTLVQGQTAQAGQVLAKQTEENKEQLEKLSATLCESVAFATDAFKETAARIMARSTKSAEHNADLLQNSLTETTATMKRDLLACVTQTQDAFSSFTATLTSLQKTAEGATRSSARVSALTDETIKNYLARNDKTMLAVVEQAKASVTALASEYEQLLQSMLTSFKHVTETVQKEQHSRKRRISVRRKKDEPVQKNDE